MLIQAKRGPHHLHVCEIVIRVLKSKLSKYLRQNPDITSDSALSSLLKKVTESYNNTRTSAGFIPSQVNSPEFDPYLRSVLYPGQQVEPFESFLAEQLRLQKEVNKPDPKARENNLERDGAFKINDEVYIDFNYWKMSGRYQPRRFARQIFRIHRIDTRQSPYLYQLKTLKDEVLGGYWYAKELTRADLDTSLEVEKIIKTRKTPNGKTLALVSYKGYDELSLWF